MTSTPPAARRRIRRPVALAAVALAAAALTLLVAELASRLLDPHDEVMTTVWEGRPPGVESYEYVIDPELGYRPVLGTGDYAEHGALINPYSLEKPDGVTRVLFLGDSVARHARIQRALANGCPEAPIEIWTAAVEGYNTVQEVAYYLRYVRAVRPDQLTLLFHNNDFLATPVVFEDPEQGLTVSIGEAALSRFDRGLLSLSNLYRHFFRRRLRSLTRRDPVTTAVATRDALRRLRRAVEEDGVALTVVLLPILKPLDEWTERELRHRQLGLEILADLELEYHDLLEPHRTAVAAGVRLSETPDDIWHPSRQSARRWVRYLLRRGYLESVLDRERCSV